MIIDSEIRSNSSYESSAETEFAWSEQLQNVEVELREEIGDSKFHILPSES